MKRTDLLLDIAAKASTDIQCGYDSDRRGGEYFVGRDDLGVDELEKVQHYIYQCLDRLLPQHVFVAISIYNSDMGVVVDYEFL